MALAMAPLPTCTGQGTIGTVAVGNLNIHYCNIEIKLDPFQISSSFKCVKINQISKTFTVS
jgi:hypothetical protein